MCVCMFSVSVRVTVCVCAREHWVHVCGPTLRFSHRTRKQTGTSLTTWAHLSAVHAGTSKAAPAQRKAEGLWACQRMPPCPLLQKTAATSHTAIQTFWHHAKMPVRSPQVRRRDLKTMFVESVKCWKYPSAPLLAAGTCICNLNVKNLWQKDPLPPARMPYKDGGGNLEDVMSVCLLVLDVWAHKCVCDSWGTRCKGWKCLEQWLCG